MSGSVWSVMNTWNRVPVGVSERELRPGMRFLASSDRPRPLGPTRQIDQVGDLGHVSTFAIVAAIGGDRRPPAACGDGETGGADWFGEVVTDREPHPTVAAGVNEPVRQASRVRPGHDLDLGRIDRQLGQRHRQDLDVIAGSVRSGVARPQNPGQGFTGGVQERQERMMPEPTLVRGGSALLVGMRRDQGGIDVDHIEAGVDTGGPHPTTRRSPRLGDPVERGRVDGLEGSPRCRGRSGR